MRAYLTTNVLGEDSNSRPLEREFDALSPRPRLQDANQENRVFTEPLKRYQNRIKSTRYQRPTLQSLLKPLKAIQSLSQSLLLVTRLRLN